MTRPGFFSVLVLLVVLLPVPTANNAHFPVFFLFRKLENEAADMEVAGLIIRPLDRKRMEAVDHLKAMNA
jgi:hypothetical protein